MGILANLLKYFPTISNGFPKIGSRYPQNGEELCHLYYAGTGSDTVYMRVSYIDRVSSITYVNGNASE